MAQMFPRWSTDDLKLAIPDTQAGGAAERELYEFMRAELPATWTVVYNTYIEVIAPTKHQHGVHKYTAHAASSGSEYRENQFDFLVFVPGKGVVNVDAKGWGYQRAGLNEVRWKGDARHPPVFTRAKGAIHTFDEYVKQKHSKGGPWGAFDSLVVFVYEDPGVDGVVYGKPSDLKRGTHELENKILHVLERHNLQEDNSKHFPKYEDNIVREFTAIVATNVKYPADYITLENYAQAKLSTEQEYIHRRIMEEYEYPYVWIEGGAGTGKTILGRKCAEEFADQGKRVLYVCFNAVLAANLSRENRRGDKLVYSHFNGLPQALVNEDLTELKNDGRPNWGRTVNRICDELPILIRQRHVRRFDVLIVDEAQDFTKTQLALLPSLMVGGQQPRHVVIMSDPGQTIYRSHDSWNKDDLLTKFPGLDHPPALDRNFRNTDKIYEHFRNASIIEMRPEIWNGRIPVQGVPYITLPVDEVNIPVAQLLQEYFKDETRHYSDVAILACTNATLKQLPARIEIAEGRNARISDNFVNWRENKTIYKSTIHSFKGLEANCLIIIDDYDRIPQERELDDVFGDVKVNDRREFLRYVGESRAKFKLIITKKV